MKKTANRARRVDDILWLGIAVAALYWVLEAFLDTVFRQGRFLDRLLPLGDPNELWMRTVIVSLIVGFALYVWGAGERKRAGEERAFLAFALESADDAIIAKTLDGTIIGWNTGAQRLYGYSAEEVKGRHISVIVPSDRGDELSAILERLKRGERVDHFETVRVRKGGDLVDVSVSISPIRNGDGKILGAALFARDVTERKRTEEALRRAEEKYRTIFENAVEGIFQFDLAGRLRLANPAMARIHGYESPADMMAEITDASRQRWVDPEDRLRFGRLLRERGAMTGLETRMRRKDGEIIWVSLNARAIRDPDGTVSGYEGTVTDITERKHAQQEILRLNAELLALTRRLELRVEERTNELAVLAEDREAFSYSVSHDLRAPLRSIDGFSQALLEDYGEELDNQGKDYLRRVRAASQRMGQLIDDLLNLSRLARTEMRRESVDLSMLAGSIGQELQQRSPEREVELVIAEGLTVWGDARLLRIALENLLGNAWKFTAKQPVARIEVGMTQQEGKTVYFVRDNGAGFDMSYVNKLFGAFQRLHSTTEFEGTGIGLTIVQRIIHRHGGRIWAEGAVGQGATFFFTLE